ncbi:MAG: hypothetical protein KJ697_01950 [Nanoarchaeota archaeon]|nr:hypothetical protein [Nanoarchaeota archaeon]
MKTRKSSKLKVSAMPGSKINIEISIGKLPTVRKIGGNKAKGYCNKENPSFGTAGVR